MSFMASNQSRLDALPIEIINQCFSPIVSPHQHDQPPRPPGSFTRPSQDVKNLRLVSKKFNELISPFLINGIRVFFASNSLLRLEGLAKNPTISKGVKRVEINTSYYDRALATDKFVFAEHRARQISLALDRYEHYGGRGVNVTPYDMAVSEWLRMTHKSSVEDSCTERQRFMLAAYGEYRHRWEDQEQVKASGYHTRRIGEALSRLGNLEMIEINDYAGYSAYGPFIYRKPSTPGDNSSSMREDSSPFSDAILLQQYLLTASTWKGLHTASSLPPPPFEVLPELFEAFEKASISSPEIQISITPPDDSRGKLTSRHREIIGKNPSLLKFFTSSSQLSNLYHPRRL